MCHCIFWSFSDSAEEVWYFHADSSCVLLPGVKSCAGSVSVFLFESFCGRDRTGPVEVCISMLHVRRIYKIFAYVEKLIELFVVHCPEGADCRFWWTVCLLHSNYLIFIVKKNILLLQRSVSRYVSAISSRTPLNLVILNMIPTILVAIWKVKICLIPQHPLGFEQMCLCVSTAVFQCTLRKHTQNQNQDYLPLRWEKFL